MSFNANSVITYGGNIELIRKQFNKILDVPGRREAVSGVRKRYAAAMAEMKTKQEEKEFCFSFIASLPSNYSDLKG